MAVRNINDFACNDGTPALPEPAGYVTTSSKAATLQELKRDLAGRSTVPMRKVDVLIATGQGTWAADGFYDQLPEAPLHVQIVPLGPAYMWKALCHKACAVILHACSGADGLVDVQVPTV